MKPAMVDIRANYRGDFTLTIADPEVSIFTTIGITDAVAARLIGRILGLDYAWVTDPPAQLAPKHVCSLMGFNGIHTCPGCEWDRSHNAP